MNPLRFFSRRRRHERELAITVAHALFKRQQELLDAQLRALRG